MGGMETIQKKGFEIISIFSFAVIVTLNHRLQGEKIVSSFN